MARSQTFLEVEARRQRVSELYARGIKEPVKLAPLFPGVSRQTIANDIRTTVARLKAAAQIDFTLAVATEFERLDWIFQEAAAAWDRSKVEPAEKTRARIKRKPVKVNGRDGHEEETITSKQTEKRIGDARYLSAALSAVEQQRALLGLDRLAAANADKIQQALAIQVNVDGQREVGLNLQQILQRAERHPRIVDDAEIRRQLGLPALEVVPEPAA